MEQGLVEGAGDAEGTVGLPVAELVEEWLEVALSQPGEMLGSLNCNDHRVFQCNILKRDNVLQLVQFVHGQPYRLVLFIQSS